MPVDQMIDKMRTRFARFHTLIIDQTTQVLNREGGEAVKVYQEKIWLKPPGYCRSKIIGRPEAQDVSTEPVPGSRPREEKRVAQEVASGQPDRNTSFRWLLMANERDEILAFLSQLGVHIDSVGFARLDGKVVYRIGDKDLKSPKLLIERETFLPLLFTYVPPGVSGENRVTVRFGNFKEVNSGWYPYTIDYASGEDQADRYFLLNLRVNPPIDTSFFETASEDAGALQKPVSEGDGKGEERLDEVIRVLKEKYGN
jgi:hypothetical protein